ncbi:hypothetical protein NESM_000649000 [Novymonas esmeraldas]|uniref:SPRY domain-containing protein n=1 Tax=Novymonas esmeraldas TaxID=1808958 RepID=A0AAW0EV87_9TRYP
MFYSGWELLSPSCMNVHALSAELPHTTATASNPADAYLTQDLLPSHDGAGDASPASASSPADVAGGAVEGLCALPRLVHRRGSPRGAAATAARAAAADAGCVLHLAARAALSFKEMEQQLHRRTTGSSDCFHVKSDAPAMSQAAVVFMECVVRGPSAPQPSTAAKSIAPALVLGVCQRSLEWYSLPGEAEHSVGFYVAQRLIVKNGSEDGDAVKLPDGSGGSRVNIGDSVGCLIDLVRHQLCFTVNRDVVATLPLDASLPDGSFYFAIGLARRPQQATDVVVRFYHGAQCMSDTAPPPRRDTSAAAAAREQRRRWQPPVFPLTQYVRTLALQWVGRCTTFLSGAEGESCMRRAAPPPTGDPAAAAALSPSSSPRHETVVPALTAKPPPDPSAGPAYNGRRMSCAPETLRDTRVAGVLRDYLSVRGMTRTLQTLDEELEVLAPTQSRPYSTASTAAAAAAAAVAAACGARSAGAPSSPLTPRTMQPHPLWRPPLPGEAQEAWQHYAADMSKLRVALLHGADGDADGTPPPPLSVLLCELTLWRPSVAYAFVTAFSGHATAATAVGGGVGRTQRGHTGTPAPLSPYEWLRRTAHPSLFTLSMLAIRQDARYLVQSHHAVEELWGILRSYLRSARAACRHIHADVGTAHAAPWLAPANGGSKDTAAAAARQDATGGRTTQTPRTGVSLSLAPSPEVERQAQAAFTSFFTHLVWNTARELPSPMTHLRRAPSPGTGGSGARSAGRSGSREGLLPTSMDTLAELAGCTDSTGAPRGAKTMRAASPGAHSGRRPSSVEEEDFRACAAACAASMRRGVTTASTGNGSAAHERHRQPPPPPPPPAPPQRPLYAAHVEEALLVLYRGAVVPAPAPSRSAQVCLLQTLSSLHTHTVSTLRQMERLVLHGGGGDVSAAVRTASDSIDLMEMLLRAVQHRYRQQVWRRLVHTVEDVNQQLEYQLCCWGALPPWSASRVQSAPAASPAGLPGAVIAGPRRWRAVTGEWLDDEAEVDHGCANEEAAASPAASTSAHRPPASPATGGGGGDDAEEPSTPSAEAMSQMHAVPRYEDVTAGLPSLRALWRRVAARAALEPSWCVITELFVQELRRSLDVAPAPRWRRRTAATTTASCAPADAALPTRAPAEVAVKRPLSAASEHSSAASDTPHTMPPASARLPDTSEDEEDEEEAAKAAQSGSEAEAAARWFAEELYLSSMYMKRVLKHVSGR